MTSTINKNNSRRNKKDEDMISSLPEDVLSHILSLMPTKFAVQTSILSKRWRYTWMSVYNIDFDDISYIYNDCGLLESVERVLALFEFKVEVFWLNFSKCIIPKPFMLRWINEAVRLNVYELDLQVKQVDIPLSLFTCKTLTKFRLDCQRYKHEWNCPSLVSLPSLKSLDIVVNSKPLHNAFKLIHGCPVLENLSLVILHRYSPENYYFEILTLKILKLSIILTSLEDINKVVLNVPNLQYLCVEEECSKSLFVIKDLSSLVEAKASFRGQSDPLWVELLKGIRKAYSKYRWLQHLCINQSKQKPYEAFCNEELQPVPRWMLTTLQTLKLTDYTGDPGDIQFLKFMLANSKVLKRLTVTFHDSLPLNEKGTLSTKLSTFPRASVDCKIRLVEKMASFDNEMVFLKRKPHLLVIG